MIPKIIHYCWFGRTPLPPLVEKCINSWRKHFPDYVIKCWNEDNFNIDSVSYVREAIKNKKWAFASDYVRLYALYNEGGIYLDTDVEVIKSFDKFVNDDFFTAVEIYPWHFDKSQISEDGIPIVQNTYIEGCGLLAAVLGAKKGHGFVKLCLDAYETISFEKDDGTLCEIVIDARIATLASNYGFAYINKKQIITVGSDKLTIFPADIFASGISGITLRTCAIHYANNSWVDKSLFDKKISNLVQHPIIIDIKKQIKKFYLYLKS